METAIEATHGRLLPMRRMVSGVCRVLLLALLILFSGSPVVAQQDGEDEEDNPKAIKVQGHAADEIGLSAGFIIKAKIVAVTETEVIYREPGTSVDKHTPLTKIQFIRKADGEYRFFSASVAPVQSTKTTTASEGRLEFYLTAGGVLHFAKNSDSAAFVSGISAYAARYFNQQLNPKGFTSTLKTDAAAAQFQFFAEPRLAYKQFMLGLSLGYAAFPQIKGVVNSPYYVGDYTITLDGFFVPAFAIFYYRIPLTEKLALNLGLGAGLLYTSIKYNENNGISDYPQRYIGVNSAAILKPEFSYKLDNLVLMLSVPIYFAESRKVESGSTSLVNGDSGKVISPNLSGLSVSLAVGLQLR